MTVISAVISRHCTAQASDSLLVGVELGGKRKPVEYEQTKIVTVRPFWGALAYWGLATYPYGSWSTHDWLKVQVADAGKHGSAEDFAEHLRRGLNTEIPRMRFEHPTHSGIGIHFTAYERVSDYSIPELFQITNWANSQYTEVFPDGFRLKRETFSTATKQESRPEHRSKECRLQVYEYLKGGGLFIYNNGDPVMFNNASAAIFNGLRSLSQRGPLALGSNVKRHLALARRPIEFVGELQRDFLSEEDRKVGGKPHDLAVTPSGEYFSTTGDKD